MTDPKATRQCLVCLSFTRRRRLATDTPMSSSSSLLVGGGCLLLSRSFVLWLSHLPCRSLSLSAPRLDCNRCDKNTQQQSPNVNNGHTTGAPLLNLCFWGEEADGIFKQSALARLCAPVSEPYDTLRFGFIDDSSYLMDESWGVEINAKARRPLDCGQALTKLMEKKKSCDSLQKCFFA